MRKRPAQPPATGLAVPAAPGRFDNLSDAALADEIGGIEAEQDGLAERMKAAKVEFERRKLDSARGEHFVVTRTEGRQKRLDTKSIRAEMGEAWYAARSKAVGNVTFRIFPANATAVTADAA